MILKGEIKMKKMFSLILIAALLLIISSTAVASTQKYLFDLEPMVQVFTPATAKAEQTDGTFQTCFVRTEKTVANNGKTYTSTAVAGDKIDFRGMTGTGAGSQNWATAMLRMDGYRRDSMPYLTGEAVAGKLYYLGARSNPASEHSSFRIVGRWTP